MEGGEGNAKRGCGRGAAVEQLTARGTEYQSPRWGAIDICYNQNMKYDVSIPAMGGNRAVAQTLIEYMGINPRDGGQ